MNATCNTCNTRIDTENDVWSVSEIDEEAYCEQCRIADLRDASIVHVVGPNYPITPDGPFSLYVGTAFIENQWGEQVNPLQMERAWIRADGWRGYFETRIQKWTPVLEGWTTGGWGDPVADRKQIFNQWQDAIYDEKIEPPVDIAFVMEPTSNVFSTSIGVWVAEDDVDTFSQWLNGELENLRYALT